MWSLQRDHLPIEEVEHRFDEPFGIEGILTTPEAEWISREIAISLMIKA